MDINQDIKAVMSDDKYMPITMISDLTGFTVPEVSDAMNTMVQAGEAEFEKVDSSLHYKLP